MIECMMVAAAMMTSWGEKVTADNAWRDYPRPQLVRANWQCLNGWWDYAIVSNSVNSAKSVPERFYGRDVEVAKGRILVPFAFESALSGVKRPVEPHERMIYHRKFSARVRPGYRTHLHFEGVDLRTQVYVNGIEATDVPHMGAQTPFALDVTDFIRNGENELRVEVNDPTSEMGSMYAAGKQILHPQSCFYTRVSGIWQTVWTEEVPETHVAGYKVTTDIDRGEVTFRFDVASPKFAKDEVEVTVGGVTAKTKDGAVTVALPKPIRLWSPETPELYDFSAKCGQDAFRGYFGMRKFERRQDAKGVWRFYLNNRPYYLLGTLDQGWWPDGLLTPPSSEACAFDIRTLKDCGYNMMRKHIKVEPQVYYALCDRLGLIVLQDMPSGSGGVFGDSQRNIQAMENRYGAFRDEWKRVVDHLFNVPSIVMWIPYNEAWHQPGEALTRATLAWTRRYDPSRLVNGPSGWNDYEGGDFVQTDGGWRIVRQPFAAVENPVSDCCDRHDYEATAPMEFTNITARVAFLGEFGGVGLRVAGHLWDADRSWGYVDSSKNADPAVAEARYLELMKRLEKASASSYGGAVYTQTTDVEIEINGLMTYDRKVFKFDRAKLREAHRRVRATVEGK